MVKIDKKVLYLSFGGVASSFLLIGLSIFLINIGFMKEAKLFLEVSKYCSKIFGFIIFLMWVQDTKYKAKYYFLYILTTMFFGAPLNMIITMFKRNITINILTAILSCFLSAFLYEYFKNMSYRKSIDMDLL